MTSWSSCPKRAGFAPCTPLTSRRPRDKLSLFLSGWLNGPNTYGEKYGKIQIPKAHAHLAIGHRRARRLAPLHGKKL